MKSSIAIICIWYKPTDKIREKWKNLANHKIYLIVVDNSPNPVYKESNTAYLTYIKLNDNKGIATAQNIGINKAKELEHKYIIFFDQDSDVTIELINQLQTDFLTIKNNGIKIGAIGPKTKEIVSGNEYVQDLKTDRNYLEVNSLISSGTFTDVSVLEDVGEMEDSLFIDIVDFEWCWRLKEKGYKLFISSNAIMPHQVGSKSFTFCGLHFIVSAPIRYFYKYRNTNRMLSRSYVPFKWKVKTLLKNWLSLLIIPFSNQYKGQKKSTLKYALKGLFSK